VSSLLNGIQRSLDASLHPDQMTHEKGLLTVCFCGPSTLGATVIDAVRQLGAQCEFSSDNQ